MQKSDRPCLSLSIAIALATTIAVAVVPDRGTRTFPIIDSGGGAIADADAVAALSTEQLLLCLLTALLSHRC